jgi:4-hydroxy-tetrahydrodipicolinate synthase
VKHGCTLRGLPSGTVRKPLRGLTKEDKRELEMVVETLRVTIAHITGIPKPEASNVVALNA